MINSGSEKLSTTWRTEFLGPHLLANIAGAGGSCTCLTTESALTTSNAVVGLFFSALWCPPCEQFLKDLLSFYESIKATQPDFEIVLISSDKDDKQFSKCEHSKILSMSAEVLYPIRTPSVYLICASLTFYSSFSYASTDFSKMPWLALPYSAHLLRMKLTKKFCIDSIPTFILLGSDGQLITKKGREKVYGDPMGVNFPWHQQTLHDQLGQQFYHGADNNLADDVATPAKTVTEINLKNLFPGDRHVALYFNAQWCAPCRPFTHILSKYCKSLAEREGSNYELQVISCSMDQEEEKFTSHFLGMPSSWLAIPYYDRWRVEALSERFNVENIPHVVMIAPDGSVLNLSARRRIELDPSAIGFPDVLSSPLVEDLKDTTKSFGFDLNSKPALILLMEDATAHQQVEVTKKIETLAVKLAKNKV